MGSNQSDALVGELRALLSPPTNFSSGDRVYLPDDTEPDDSKRVKNSLIAEANAVLDSPERWVKQWDGGRTLSDSDIDACVVETDRKVFHRLDSILQAIFELPRVRGASE